MLEKIYTHFGDETVWLLVRNEELGVRSGGAPHQMMRRRGVLYLAAEPR